MFLDRTYNFQVDNGLFVAEHILKKDYKDITLEDLKNGVDKIAKQMFDYNKLGTLASQSHHNSALTQKAFKENRLEKIGAQLYELLDNVSNHKNCAICGEKRVNVEMLINSPYMALIPSFNKFANRSNNLHTIDICTICLFLSYISFLNTQKISFAFLYISDSDEFMRDRTKEIQLNVSKDIFLEMQIDKSDIHFLDVMKNIADDLDLYEDLTYIDLIYYANSKSNRYKIQTIDKKQLLFLMKLKNEGLLHEFATLKLFKAYFDGKLTLDRIIKSDKKGVFKINASTELYRRLEGYLMTNKDVQMIEYTTEVLLESNSIEGILKELKMCSTHNDFEKFILKHSEEKALYKTLNEFNELKNIYKYKNMLIANLILSK